MRVVEITRFGGPEVLLEAQRPKPVPGPGEMLIEVQASGVNRPDVLQRRGAYAPPPGASDIPGLELAGRVAGGDPAELAAAGWTLGDSVCALVSGGGYAEYCVAPIPQCLPVPAGLSLLEAASLPETFFTVWSNVFDRGGLVGGNTLLVHGGSSGIGVTAIQLGKAMGARVLVTATPLYSPRSPEAA
jgi:NADPH2:quinone reductase